MAELKTNVLLEDFIQKTWHPSQIQKWLDAGLDVDGSVLEIDCM